MLRAAGAVALCSLALWASNSVQIELKPDGLMLPPTSAVRDPSITYLLGPFLHPLTI